MWSFFDISRTGGLKGAKKVEVAAGFQVFIAPLVPTIALKPREQFQERPRGTALNQVVKLVRFSGVFAFPGLDDVNLRAARLQRPFPAPNAEEHQLRHIAE